MPLDRRQLLTRTLGGLGTHAQSSLLSVETHHPAKATRALFIFRVGGPSIVPPFPVGLLEQKFTAEALKMPTGDRHRRGIYIHVQRTLPHPSLTVFDGTAFAR